MVKSWESSMNPSLLKFKTWSYSLSGCGKHFAYTVFGQTRKQSDYTIWMTDPLFWPVKILHINTTEFYALVTMTEMALLHGPLSPPPPVSGQRIRHIHEHANQWANRLNYPTITFLTPFPPWNDDRFSAIVSLVKLIPSNFVTYKLQLLISGKTNLIKPTCRINLNAQLRNGSERATIL